jgi:hypothetical protein
MSVESELACVFGAALSEAAIPLDVTPSWIGDDDAANPWDRTVLVPMPRPFGEGADAERALSSSLWGLP